MPFSYKDYTGDGSTATFSITFDYQKEAEISVTVDGVAQSGFTFPSSTQVQLTTAPAASTLVRIRRTTDLDAREVDFASGSVLTEEDLDNSNIQVFHAAQEAIDTSNDAISLDDDDKWDAQSKVIKNVANPTNAQDVATKDYLENTWLTAADKAQLNSLDLDNLDDVADDIANVNTVATNIADVNTVAARDADIDTVAARDADIGTVAARDADIGTVADRDADIGTVADRDTEIGRLGTADAVSDMNTLGTAAIVADMDTLADIATDITTVAHIEDGTVATNAVQDVAAIDSDVTTVAGVASNVTTVAGVSSDVTTVAGISSDVTTVANDGTDIGTVAGISSDVTTVAGIDANVTTVAGISSDVTAVANISQDIQDVQDEIANLQTVANDLNEATSEIETVAASIANVDLVGADITNVNTVATNISDVNNFADTYFISATAPASPTQGDLWFDTDPASLVMKVYDGSGWVNAGSSVNGTSERNTYTATGGQTTFAATYDAGYVDVYLNGVKLIDGSDFTATSGSSIVLSTGATAGDTVDIVAYGTFELLNTDLNDLSDVSTAGVTSGQFLKYDGANWVGDTVSTDLVADTTPQLGGNLDAQSNDITSVGNMGIGTTSPTERLHIREDGADASILVRTQGASVGTYHAAKLQFELGASSSSTRDWDIVADDPSNNGGYLGVEYEGSEKFRIASSGNVGIGTASLASDVSLSVSKDIKLVTPTGTKSRLYSKTDGTGTYTLGTSGGAAIVMERLSDNSDEIAFETHYAGNSHTERMRIDKQGRVTMPYQPSFYAYGSSDYLSQSGAFAYSSTSFNTGGHYNTSTYRFTAPVAGLYYFSAGAIMQASASDGSVVLVKNGTFTFAKDYTSGSSRTSNVSSVIYLNANDYVFVDNEGNPTWYLADGYGFFSGCLIG